jgi:glycosyltransferase involved in cell wall biosynthesis
MQQMTEPYSVLMAVYNKESSEHLKQSFDSILNQTLPAKELVLVCDGPLSSSLDKVIDQYVSNHKGFFRVIRFKTHMGLGPALREGLMHCNHEYIARMDSDDISCPDRCEKQLAFMKERQLDLCSGVIAEFTDNPEAIFARRVLPVKHEELVHFARRRSPMNHPCVMFRRSKVMNAGNYREMSRFEDYDLWIRMIQKGARLGNLTETLLYMRIGQVMFRRRGGFDYVKAIACFWKTVYSQGFINLFEYFFVVMSRIAVSLFPDVLRAGFYRLWLREA